MNFSDGPACRATRTWRSDSAAPAAVLATRKPRLSSFFFAADRHHLSNVLLADAQGTERPSSPFLILIPAIPCPPPMNGLSEQGLEQRCGR